MSLNTDLGQLVKQSLATTPGYMAALQLAICAAAMLFFLSIWAAVDDHRSALKTVCEDTAPSIAAAQTIKAKLADLDANAANGLLLPESQKNQEAQRDYDQDSKDLTDNVVAAARNITYQEEIQPIKDVENGLARYAEIITRARAHHEQNDPAFVADYLQATDLVHAAKTGLLDRAEALDAANRTVLDATYADQRFWGNVTCIVVLATGGLLLFCLLRAQSYLSARMRRTFNQGLVAATVVAVVLLAQAEFRLVGSGHDLKWAKADAFDSVSALMKARATAYDANGAESRWLLAMNANNPAAADFQQQFDKLSQEVASLPNHAFSYDQVAAQCAGTTAGLPQGFTGDLATELGNITFDGEFTSARSALIDWGKYISCDALIRADENQGRHQAAVTLCCGTNPGQSNYLFNQFDQEALGKTLQINQDQFGQANAAGQATLKGFEWFAAIATAAIIALTLWGFRPRFAEYRS